MWHQTSKEIKEELKIIQRAVVEPEVFGLIYEKYYKDIFIFINRRTDDKQTTADLVSQVFLKAMINLPKYKFKGLPFSAWLFRIASNQVNEFFRNAKNQRVVSLQPTHTKDLFEENDIQLDAQIDRNELLIKLLDHLDEEDVEIIELRYFEQRSFKEVAYILDIKENAAKVRVHRIVGKLRKILEKPELLNK